MGRKWRTTAAAGCLVGMLASFVPSMAQQPATSAKPNPAVQAAPASSGTPTLQTAARQQPGGEPARTDEEVDAGQIEWSGNHTVNLDSEGNVRGRVSLLDPRTGRPTPVDNAIVSFVQGGRLLNQVRTGSDGRFTVRLRPGVYSVIAQAPAGFGAFAVFVKPYDPTASDPLELVLDGTLIPTADIQALNGPIAGLPLPAPGGAPGGPFGGGGGFTGGGGGGGDGSGGLGGLLGIAGLAAGLSALANNDDPNPVVVPASPVAP